MREQVFQRQPARGQPELMAGIRGQSSSLVYQELHFSLVPLQMLRCRV